MVMIVVASKLLPSCTARTSVSPSQAACLRRPCRTARLKRRGKKKRSGLHKGDFLKEARDPVIKIDISSKWYYCRKKIKGKSLNR